MISQFVAPNSLTGGPPNETWLKNYHPFKPDEPEEAEDDIPSAQSATSQDSTEEEDEPFDHNPRPGSFEDRYGVII